MGAYAKLAAAPCSTCHGRQYFDSALEFSKRVHCNACQAGFLYLDYGWQRSDWSWEMLARVLPNIPSARSESLWEAVASIRAEEDLRFLAKVDKIVDPRL